MATTTVFLLWEAQLPLVCQFCLVLAGRRETKRCSRQKSGFLFSTSGNLVGLNAEADREYRECSEVWILSAVYQCAQTIKGSGQSNEGPLCLLGRSCSWTSCGEKIGQTKLVGPSWSTQVGRTGCEKACSRREYERAEEVVGAGRILAAHLGSSSGKPCCIIAQPSTPPIIIIVIITHSTAIISSSSTNHIQIVSTIHQNPLTLHVITITIKTAIMVDQKSLLTSLQFVLF